MTPSARQEQTPAHADQTATTRPSAPAASTLIEFPTPGRAPKPQWRKELSERVREIQQRKAEEAAREADATTQADATMQAYAPVAAALPSSESVAVEPPALGLVPPAPAPEVNPLVVAALKRIERARQQTSAPAPRVTGRGRGTAAAARVAREEYEVAPEVAAPAPAETHPMAEQLAPPQQAEVIEAAPVEQPLAAQTTEQPVEAPRPLNLVAVPSRAELEAAERKQTRKHIPVVLDEAYLARREAAELATAAVQAAPQATAHAPLPRRVVGGVVDLLVVAFAATPFAAVMELTNGNWSDPRVSGSLGGIVVVLLFLYLMAATALAGRTWGMSLVALRTVDAGTGRAPTTGQCVRRAFGFLLALATGGLGLLYAAFDAKGRALQDHISGTIIVRE
ncbi:MAG: RDD family protein [Pyrinomonadaceae bacterium]